MINLFTSQASTWRGGRVKPVEPSFFWYCGGGLPSFHFYSFTLLSIMYITSFRLQNKRLILQARVQIANSCNFSMWDTLIIIFFIFLLFLAVAHVAACGLSSTGFHLSTYTGHHRRESGLPLLCPLSPVWPLLVGWEIGRKQRFKKKKNGVAFLKIHKSYHLKAAKGDCFMCLVVKDFRRAGPGQRWGAIGELAHPGCSMLWSIHTRGSEGEAPFGWDPQVDSRCGWRNLGNLGHVFFFSGWVRSCPWFWIDQIWPHQSDFVVSFFWALVLSIFGHLAPICCIFPGFRSAIHSSDATCAQVLDHPQMTHHFTLLQQTSRCFCWPTKKWTFFHTDIDWIWSNLGIGSDKPSLVSPGHGTAAFGESDYQIAFQVGGARSLWEFVGLSMGWVSRRFLGIFPGKCHKLVGKREESCRMMHPDSYSSCHTPPAQELSFFENRASQEKIVTCRFQEHWSGKLANKRLIFPTLLVSKKQHVWSCAIWGLKMVDYLERMRWLLLERNIAPMKGETRQCWTQEFQPVSTFSTGFNQSWSVWFLLKETFILGCPPSQVYRDPLLLLVLTKNNNPGGDWNPRQGLLSLWNCRLPGGLATRDRLSRSHSSLIPLSPGGGLLKQTRDAVYLRFQPWVYVLTEYIYIYNILYI